MHQFHPLAHKCQRIALHPRTQAIVEVAYATHGIIGASHWSVIAIYAGILLVSLAHLIWVHLE